MAPVAGFPLALFLTLVIPRPAADDQIGFLIQRGVLACGRDGALADLLQVGEINVIALLGNHLVLQGALECQAAKPIAELLHLDRVGWHLIGGDI